MSENLTSTIHRLNQKEPHIVTLIVMSTFASMGAVIFTPALPEIAHYFNIPQGLSQLTITLFLFGYALGQLIYAPLANYFGRKHAFFVGIILATIGTIISIISEPLNSFTFLLIGRMLEALGSSAGLIIAFTIVNDHYYPNQARKIVAYMMLAFAIIPGIATFIGGILVTYFHWISCFYFLLIYGLLLAVPVSVLKETALTLDKKALYMKQIFKSYVKTFKNNTLRRTSLYLGLSSTCIYIYASTAPFIGIHDLHFSPQLYGIIGLIPYTGTAFGSIFLTRLSHYSTKALIKTGYLIEIIGAIFLTILFVLQIVNIYILIACGFIFMFGNCLIASNVITIGMSTAENKANASAIMNFINVGMAVCGTFIQAFIPISEIIKLPICFLMALALMMIVWSRIPHST